MRERSAKVSGKGQITIPQTIREELGIEGGDYLLLEFDGNRVVLTAPLLQPTDDFALVAARIAERLAANGVTRSDVEEAIRWARESR